jgi:hypothetical protein
MRPSKGPGLFWCSLTTALVALCMSGCAVNMMALPYFLMSGGNMADPQVKLVKKKKDKKKVVVLAYAPSGLQWGFDVIDGELASQLVDQIANAEPRLEVVSEREVRAWRDVNTNWMDKNLQEIGEHFDVDYVLFVEAAEFTLNESKNQYLLKGRTRMLFKVHDVNKDQVIFDQEYVREYPRNRPISIQDVTSEEQFRKAFMRQVTKELSWYVVPHSYEEEANDL